MDEGDELQEQEQQLKLQLQHGDRERKEDEEASLSQPHASLLSIGEGCVHIVCEYLRFDGKAVSHLSRLSQTCRALYVAVRNLPSVLDTPSPMLFTVPLPRKEVALQDVA